MRMMLKKKDLEEHLGVKLKILGYGFDRVGYRYRGIVFKVPRHERGMDCNQFEIDNWGEAKSERVTTRPLWVQGVLIAMQPYLPSPPPGFVYPRWSDYYDCAQGGINHKGEFKIYDFPPNWMGMAATYGY